MKTINPQTITVLTGIGTTQSTKSNTGYINMYQLPVVQEVKIEKDRVEVIYKAESNNSFNLKPRIFKDIITFENGETKITQIEGSWVPVTGGYYTFEK